MPDNIHRDHGLGAPRKTRPQIRPTTSGEVQLERTGQQRLEIRYYDSSDTYRCWDLPLDLAFDVARWWIEQGSKQDARGALAPEEKVGRMSVLVLSRTQVFCRGTDAWGRPNITGFQFPRAVVDALAGYLASNSQFRF